MAANAPTAKELAANALWAAIEERRDRHRDAKVTFDERQHHQIRVAHEEGRLFEWVNGAMERRYRNPPPMTSASRKAMARTKKAGLGTWEDIMIRPGQPWTPYITPRAKLGAKECVADAVAYIPYL